MYFFREFEFVVLGAASDVVSSTVIRGTASVVDAEVKRIFLIDRFTLEVLDSNVVRSDNTWEMNVPSDVGVSDILLLGLDDGENFNADVFDLLTGEELTFTGYTTDMVDRLLKQTADFRKAETLEMSHPISDFSISKLPSFVHESETGDTALLALQDETDPQAFVAKYDDTFNRLKGVAVTSLATELYPWCKRETTHPFVILDMDNTGWTEDMTDVTLPIRIEDYPDVADQYDPVDFKIYVTTSTGDLLYCEMNNWNDTAKTGVLWIHLDSIDYDDPPTILLTVGRPLTNNVPWDQETEFYVCAHHEYVIHFDTDGFDFQASDEVYYYTYGHVWTPGPYFYLSDYGIMHKVNKSDGTRVSGWSSNVGSYLFAGQWGNDGYLYTYAVSNYKKVRETDGVIVQESPVSTGNRYDVVKEFGKLVSHRYNLRGVELRDLDSLDIVDIFTLLDKSFAAPHYYFLDSFDRMVYSPNSSGKCIIHDAYKNSYSSSTICVLSVLNESTLRHTIMNDGTIAMTGATTDDIYCFDRLGRLLWINTQFTADIQDLKFDGNGDLWIVAGAYVYKLGGNDGVQEWSYLMNNSGYNIIAPSASHIRFGHRFHESYDDILDINIWDSKYDAVYHMDTTLGTTDDVVDVSGNDNHATSSNMSSGNVVDSNLGKGITFDGVNEFLTLSGLYTSEQASGQIDIVFETGETTGVLISQDATGWNDLDSIVGVGDVGVRTPGDGKPVMETHGPNTSDERGINSSTSVDDDAVHVITVMWDGSNYSMCIDGVFETDLSTTEGFWGADGLSDILIGKSDASGNHFEGTIDLIHIHNTPRTKSSVIAFHKAVLGTLFSTPQVGDTYNIGMDVSVSFDDENTFKVWTGTAWRTILTKDATEHGGSDDNCWYINNGGTGDPVYGSTGTWVSEPIRFMNGEDSLSSLIDWIQALPTNTTVAVSSAWETSATEPVTAPTVWDTVTKNSTIPNTPTTMTNQWLWLKIVLTTTDTSESPSIKDLSVSVTHDIAAPTAGESWSPPLITNAKSIVVDLIDNWGGADVGFRHFGFFLGDAEVAVYDYTFDQYYSHRYSTQEDIEDGFDIRRTRIDGQSSAAYRSSIAGTTRIIIVFDNPISFDRILVCNYHQSGGVTNYGMKNFDLTVTPDEYTTTTYQAAVTNGVDVIVAGQIVEHIDENIYDERLYAIDNSGGIDTAHTSSNIVESNGVLKLGGTGDTGYRIADPIDLGGIVFESLDMSFFADINCGLQLVPIMTSNTSLIATDGTPCSSEDWDYSASDHWKMFDRDIDTRYRTRNIDNANAYPWHIGFAFIDEQVVEGFKFWSINDYPADLKIEGSNDGVNWIEAHEYGDTVVRDGYTHGFTNKKAFKTWRLSIGDLTGGSYGYANILQFYGPAVQIKIAIVDSATEPSTPPADSSFTRIYPGETTLPGVEVGDDLHGKWLWIKQVIECDWDKPSIFEFDLTITGSVTKEKVFNDSVKWLEADSNTGLDQANVLGIAVASGKWDRALAATLPELLIEASEKDTGNRMAPATLADVDGTDITSGGYSSTTGDVSFGAVLYNKATSIELQVRNFNVNDKRYLLTEEYDLPSLDVTDYAVLYWTIPDLQDFDLSGVKAYSRVGSGDWVQVANSGDQIVALAVDTDMTGLKAQFKFEVPNDFPINRGIRTLFQLR